MRKQTKLVAVLSTAALLALGASMSSFAATGWAEENGTWVYYDKNGDLETEKWEKSGDSWFYLNEDGEMAVETLVEDDDNYYYVDANGAMVSNKWISIENVDYDGSEDEPANFWYYFGANGKAFKNTSSDIAFKTINSAKYAFDAEGKMLYGWVDGSASDADYTNGLYYLGDENDGAQKTGWHKLATEEDKTGWFWFGTNGKKVSTAEKTVNGKKYSFDADGVMQSGWVKVAAGTTSTASTASTASFEYYGSEDDGAKVVKGWFKVVPHEDLNPKDHADDAEGWYYADNGGKVVRSAIQTVNGQKYLFGENGKMMSGLQLVNPTDFTTVELGDTVDDFKDAVEKYDDYVAYYFGGKEDGAMKTGKQTVSIDGESVDFLFKKSGSSKGAGVVGGEDGKFYVGGLLLKASKDDKYAVVDTTTNKLISTVDFFNDFKGNDTIEKRYKLISTTGSIQKNKNKAKDGNDICFKVVDEFITSVFEEN